MTLIRMFVGLGAMLLGFTACGGSGVGPLETAVPVGDTGASVETETATAARQADEIVPVNVPPCDLLSTDEVAAATGLTVVEVRDEPPIACIFDLGEEAGVEVWITIEDGGGRLVGPANLFKEYMALEANGEAEVVPDVGERAVCCPFRAIAVDAGGGRFFAVSVGGFYTELAEPREELIALANAALERLE